MSKYKVHLSRQARVHVTKIIEAETAEIARFRAANGEGEVINDRYEHSPNNPWVTVTCELVDGEERKPFTVLRGGVS